ncbi:MAG TPA: hypothetical protein DD490_18780 [Acidobacteria bacterium]|nr:hypothetical protein [Acidobacteriota bacterium]
MNRSVVAPLAALLLSSFAALPAAAQEGPVSTEPIPSLTVSADGEVRSAPDEATVRLGVSVQTKTAQEAQDQVNRIAAAVLDAVGKLGVPAAHIQTSELNLGPVYGQGRPGGELQEPQIVGYQASNVVSIQIVELDKIGPVIDAGLGAGANRLEGVTFGLRNDRPARTAALRQAVEEARAKAETLAAGLQVRLVRILEVTEGGIAVTPQPFFKSRSMAMESAMADTPVAAGQVGVSGSVTIRWEIAPL